ncbi:MAG TPA: MFS transporter [Phenylobacterium sp.]
MSSQGPSAKPLSLPLMLAFAATSLPLSAISIAIGVYLPPYFARNLGVELTVVGGAFALIRLIDIPLDPLLGWAMDKTRTRWGRYRMWTLAGAPVVMASIYMLFMAPHGVGLAYIMTWLLVMYLGTSMLTLAHSAWGASLASNYNARARIFGVMAAVGVSGAAMVLLMPVFIKAAGLDEEAFGVQGMGWFILALTPIAVLLVIWRTPETVAPEVAGHGFKIKEYWSLIARPTMARIMTADLLLALGPGWMSALYIFFFTDSRGFSTAHASMLLLTYVLAGFLGAPLMARLAMRISKHRAVMVATTGYSLLLCTLLLLPKGNFLLFLIPLFGCGFLAAGFTVLLRAMTADVADEVRLDQGRERSGLLYALTTLTNKVAGAISISLTFAVLAQVGYQAQRGAVNTPDAIHSLEIAFLSGPILFVMLGGLCMVGYKLGPERTAEIRRQLDERDRVLYDQAPIIETLAPDAAAPQPQPSR